MWQLSRLAHVARVQHPARCLSLLSARWASHGHGKADECDPEAGTHGDHAQHDDHHHAPDPYATWYEDPPSNLVWRSSRLKIPFYLGKVPEASYREPSNTDMWWMRWIAWTLGVLFWWWLLWGFLAEPAHLWGEFHIPDRRQWTDAELGIPPLSEFPVNPPRSEYPVAGDAPPQTLSGRMWNAL